MPSSSSCLYDSSPSELTETAIKLSLIQIEQTTCSLFLSLDLIRAVYSRGVRIRNPSCPCKRKDGAEKLLLYDAVFHVAQGAMLYTQPVKRPEWSAGPCARRNYLALKHRSRRFCVPVRVTKHIEAGCSHAVQQLPSQDLQTLLNAAIDHLVAHAGYHATQNFRVHFGL